MNKAIFFDRDGIILQMVYDLEHGVIDTVKHPKQIAFVPGIIELLQHTASLGYYNIIVSNQPGVALKKVTKKQFTTITKTMLNSITKQGGTIHASYFCLHHPFAKIRKYRENCTCRKPGVDLFSQAAKEHHIDLKQSWIIGDGVSDIVAGNTIGAKTILLGNIQEAEYFRILEEQLGEIKPTYIVKKLTEAIDRITT